LKYWYAIYVKSKTEKRVASELSLMEIDNYLPLRRVLRQWSDRKKWIEDPLFKSYVFVNIEQKDYYTVLQTPGVVKYISFEGKAVPIPPQQIDAIKYYLEEKNPEQAGPTNWSKGQHVEVISGSMTGLTGKLVAFKGKHWLGIEIEAIGHSIIIQIQKNKLRPL
jgi:transcriptional antiterminator RfaH